VLLTRAPRLPLSRRRCTELCDNEGFFAPAKRCRRRRWQRRGARLEKPARARDLTFRERAARGTILQAAPRGFEGRRSGDDSDAKETEGRSGGGARRRAIRRLWRLRRGLVAAAKTLPNL